jgi:hypothetical protein
MTNRNRLILFFVTVGTLFSLGLILAKIHRTEFRDTKPGAILPTGPLDSVQMAESAQSEEDEARRAEALVKLHKMNQG